MQPTHKITVIAERLTSPLEMHNQDRQSIVIGLLEKDYDVSIFFERVENDSTDEDTNEA